jgi:hypothetical protein
MAECLICVVLFSKPFNCRLKPKLERNNDKIQSEVDKILIGLFAKLFEIRYVFSNDLIVCYEKKEVFYSFCDGFARFSI